MRADGNDGAGGDDSAPDRKTLVAAWTRAFGYAPPKGIGMRLLSLGIAYQEQSERQGGLSTSTKKRLLAIANGKKPVSAKSANRLTPGTRLVRDWRDESHIVEVLPNGFLYRGETFSSLSEIARTITGARWSGPRFFGVDKS